METSMESILERLKVFRKEEKTSVEELAESLNLKYTNLYSQLSGQRTLSVETLSKILSVFPDLSMDWVMTGEGEMYRSKREIAGELEAERRIAENETKHREEVMRLQAQIDVLMQTIQKRME